jgi:hypothetical protein
MPELVGLWQLSRGDMCLEILVILEGGLLRILISNLVRLLTTRTSVTLLLSNQFGRIHQIEIQFLFDVTNDGYTTIA